MQKLRMSAIAVLAGAWALAGCGGVGSVRKAPLRPVVERVCNLADSALVRLPKGRQRDGLAVDILVTREAFEIPADSTGEAR